jgi:hypothetical protein
MVFSRTFPFFLSLSFSLRNFPLKNVNFSSQRCLLRCVVDLGKFRGRRRLHLELRSSIRKLFVVALPDQYTFHCRWWQIPLWGVMV